MASTASSTYTSDIGSLSTQATGSNTAFHEARTPPTATSGPQSTGDTGHGCDDSSAPEITPQALPIRIRLRLNNPEATDSNERGSEVNPSTSSAKRQKRAQTMAEPTTANSIRYAHFNGSYRADHKCRNICMRHWKQTQPGGQGLLSDFESHFKSLSDTDKEVCIPQLDGTCITLTDVTYFSPTRRKCRLCRSRQ